MLEITIDQAYDLYLAQKYLSEKTFEVSNEKLLKPIKQLKQEILNDIANLYIINQDKITKLQNKISIVRQYLNEYKDMNIFLQAAKAITDGLVYAGRKYEDASGLWVLMSSNFTRGLDYLNKNGKLVEHISDLNNPELETIVRKKCIEQNFNTTDPKGIIFHKDSSLAKSIVQSSEFKNKIWTDFKKLLVNKKEILNSSISMEWDYLSAIDFDISINNYLSSHKCEILNLYIRNNVVYATLFDTEDYNDWKVLLPKLLQDQGIIKNYYFIIEIEMPLNKIFSNDEDNLI